MKIARHCIWIYALILNAIGLATLYSATAHATAANLKNSFQSQSLYTLLAIGAALVLSRLTPSFWKFITPWAYLVTVLGLIWVIVDNQKINNAASWIQIANISIQPTEFFKLTLILALARVLQFQRQEHPLQELLLVASLSAIPLILIFKQPDLGSALALIPVILALCHVAGYELPRLGMLVILGSFLLLSVLLAPIWGVDILPLHSYQLGRIVRLFHQDGFSPLEWLGNRSTTHLIIFSFILMSIVWWRNQSWKRWTWLALIVSHLVPLTIWTLVPPSERHQQIERFLKPYRKDLQARTLEEPQLKQAKYALANGYWLGQGWLEGEQTQYQRLSNSYSDLIFASLAEEWGLIGTSLTLGIYLSLVSTLVFIGSKIRRPFQSLVVYGIACMIATQVAIHIGYTVGLIPMTGITLPFVSAGGSSLMTCWLSLGLVYSCTHDESRLS